MGRKKQSQDVTCCNILHWFSDCFGVRVLGLRVVYKEFEMSWILLLVVFSCPLILAVGWIGMQFRLAKMEKNMVTMSGSSHYSEDES